MGSLHSVFVCKHACAAIAKAFLGAGHVLFWHSSSVLASCSSGALASQAAPLERRGNAKMKCALPPPKPLQWLHKHASTQTHYATRPHSVCPSNTHTYIPPNTWRSTAPVHTQVHPSNEPPTNKPTNQPTNQPTYLQPTRQPNSAGYKPIKQQPTKHPEDQANKPTSQVPLHTGRGAIP